MPLGAADVAHVMVGGRWLLYDRQFTTLDWPALARQVSADQSRSARLLPPPPPPVLNEPLDFSKNDDNIGS